MIREFEIGTANGDEDEYYEPPTGLLKVSLIGDDAFLDWAPHDGPVDPARAGEEPPKPCSFRVPARSLLLALRAAWDDRHPGTADIDLPRPRRDRGPTPANSHQPWTDDLDAQLRAAWLDAAPPAEARISELAERMGRSENSIQSRLVRIGCDPYVPGRMFRQTEGVQVVHRGEEDDEPF